MLDREEIWCLRFQCGSADSDGKECPAPAQHDRQPSRWLPSSPLRQRCQRIHDLKHEKTSILGTVKVDSIIKKSPKKYISSFFKKRFKTLDENFQQQMLQ